MSEVMAKVGQHWRSRDRRDFGSNERIVEIVAIDGLYARTKNVKTGKETRILLKRMKPNAKGFELVKDVEDAAPKAEPEAAAYRQK